MLLKSYRKELVRHECRPEARSIGCIALFECGQPTCMVFAAQAAEGGRSAEDCPPLGTQERAQLGAYLAQFQFE